MFFFWFSFNFAALFSQMGGQRCVSDLNSIYNKASPHCTCPSAFTAPPTYYLRLAALFCMTKAFAWYND